jgi:predicted PurR-regulated permease PerM
MDLSNHDPAGTSDVAGTAGAANQFSPAGATAPEGPRRPRRRTAALTVLATLAVFYTLHFAREFLLPLGIAILLSLVLAPLVRALRRLHIPEPLGALAVLALFIGGLVYGIGQIAAPAEQWLARAPETMRTIEGKLRPLRKPVEQMTKATEQVGRLTDLGGNGEETVAVSEGGGRSFLQRTWTIAANVVVTLMLMYFLLASGDRPLRQLLRALPTLSDKKTALEIAARIREDVSAYLASITVINIGFGVVVGAAMWGLGMPSPLLWGVVAGLTNYIPYLGAILCGGILTIVALLTFPDVRHALLVPAAFFALNLIESYAVTPFAIARKLTLSPLAIFLAVSFWGWIWGVAGMLVAVPFLAILKILCDHIPNLKPVGEFLSE